MKTAPILECLPAGKTLLAGPVLLLALHQGCGTLRLTGDPVDAVCGNGIREQGEECDGNSEPCETQGCGGGVRRCRSDCTWAECEEDAFKVLAGPRTVSGPANVWGPHSFLLWTGSMFDMIFVGEGQDEVFDRIFLSTASAEAEMLRDPLDVTPPLLNSLALSPLYAALANGEFPIALLFRHRPPESSNSIPVFNSMTTDGVLRWDLGRLPFGETTWSAGPMEASASGTVGLFSVRFPLPTFCALDMDGLVLGETVLECGQGDEAHPGMIVREGPGVAAFYTCEKGSDEDGYDLLMMQRFDGSGAPLADAIAVLEQGRHALSPEKGMAAAWSGSSFGVTLVVLDPDVYPDALDLYFLLLDQDGNAAHEPRPIGTLDTGAFDQFDAPFAVAWTGSEFGIAHVDHVEGSTFPDNLRSTVKLTRVSVEGDTVGRTLVVYDESSPHNVDVEWTGSAYGLTWIEPMRLHPDERVNLSLAVVGCGPP
jgi:hypothetical protein